MKKGTVCKVFSIFLAIITMLAIVGAITVTGSGFLDLSNIVRGVCVGVGVVCGIIAGILWKYAKS